MGAQTRPSTVDSPHRTERTAPESRTPLGAGILLAVLGLTAATAVPASAYQPVDIVHTEHVRAGPYAMTVGFTTWPLTLSWAISSLPLLGLITFVVIAWRRTRPALTAGAPATPA